MQGKVGAPSVNMLVDALERSGVDEGAALVLTSNAWANVESEAMDMNASTNPGLNNAG